jgi:hypothetical protein
VRSRRHVGSSFACGTRIEADSPAGRRAQAADCLPAATTTVFMLAKAGWTFGIGQMGPNANVLELIVGELPEDARTDPR